MPARPACRASPPRRPSPTTDPPADETHLDPAARSFLEEEAAAWEPFAALLDLGDDELQASIGAAHDWSGRDLLAHLVAWLEDAIDVATDLHRADHSDARERSRQAFRTRGDEMNAEIQSSWGALPMDEVRRRIRATLEDLRGRLATMPAQRWRDNPEDIEFFRVYTLGHYEDHAADLEAILAAPSGGRTPAP